jgi:hypothetical protein
MERREQRDAHRADANCAPRSLVMVSGTPNLWIQPCSKAVAQSAADTDSSGIASGQRVVLSKIVKI